MLNGLNLLDEREKCELGEGEKRMCEKEIYCSMW